MKKYCKSFLIVLLLGVFIFPGSTLSKLDENFKVYSENIPLYSFTNPIKSISMSQNGEKIIIQVTGKKSGKTSLYITNKNGFGIKEIFVPGTYQVGTETLYLDNTDLQANINGNGTKVIIGLRPIRNVEKRTDYIFVYDIQKQKTTIVPLRILVAGCNYVRFPQQTNANICYSMDFEGNKIIAQVEYGFQSIHCSKFDTGLVLMNIDGSNQTNFHGPEEFVASTCSFYWKKFPKSPHQGTLTYEGDRVVFFGQIYETPSPYDKNGDLFILNTNGSNLKQLTFSKRFDSKPESLGSFKINFYGSEVLFKRVFNNNIYLSSVNLVDGIIKNHFTTTSETNFMPSGDSRKIFTIDPMLGDSLAYYDIQKENKCILIDRTWSGAKNNYGMVGNITAKDLFSVNLTNFDGSVLLVPINQEWVYWLQIDKNLLTSQIVNLEFKIGSITAKIGIRLISLSSAPYSKNGRTMIPAKLFAETFGLKFVWSPKDQSLQLKLDGNNLTVYIGKSYLYFNGKKLSTPVSPEIASNQVYIPAVWARDFFNLKLIWNPKTQILLIERTNN